MRISDCVLLLLGRPIDSVEMDPDRPCVKPSWSCALKVLSGNTFLQSLQHFNKDTINDEVVELLEPYFDMPDYSLEVAKKVRLSSWRCNGCDVILVEVNIRCFFGSSFCESFKL